MKEAEVFICSLCQRNFYSKSLIVKHMLYTHNNEPTIQNLERKRRMHRTFKQRKSNKNVPQSNSPIEQSNSQTAIKKPRVYSKEYCCDKCPYKTVHLSTFNRHKLTHEKGGRKHQCTFCSFATVQPYNLERHLKDIHPFGPVEPLILIKA